MVPHQSLVTITGYTATDALSISRQSPLLLPKLVKRHYRTNWHLINSRKRVDYRAGPGQTFS